MKDYIHQIGDSDKSTEAKLSISELKTLANCLNKEIDRLEKEEKTEILSYNELSKKLDYLITDQQ